MLTVTYYDSPLGRMLLAAEDEALCGLWFVGQKYFPAALAENAGPQPTAEILKDCTDWLDRYFAGDRPPVSQLSLAPKGSEFRRRVWDILLSIDYGQSVSYGQIAKQLEQQTGRRVSAQAVGGAVGHNPISIIIPCHRVIGADGSLTGYAGGLEKKKALLEFEQGIRKLPVG